MTTLELLTATDIENFANQHRHLSAEYRNLAAIAQQVRCQIDAIYNPIFDRYQFVDDEGSPIATHQELYLCPDDAAFERYVTECHAAIKAAGFDVEFGICPALTAEHNARMKRQEIIGKMCELMGMEVYRDDLQEKLFQLFLSMTR
jgi:hypothetical protein